MSNDSNDSNNSNEYKTFYDNVVRDEDMLHEMAKDPASFQAVVDHIANITGGRTPGGDFIRLSELVCRTVLVHSEVAQEFSDNDMLLIYTSYFNKWFALEHFQDIGAGFNNPIFGAIQQAFTNCAKLDHYYSMNYLMSNVHIKDYDVDGLDLAIALEERSEAVLELFNTQVPKDTYGDEGQLTYLIKPEIQRAYFDACSSWLRQELNEGLGEFKLIRG